MPVKGHTQKAAEVAPNWEMGS